MKLQNKTSLSLLVKDEQYSSAFRRVLKDGAEQFVSSLLQIGSTMPDVEPRSIVGAAMTAAALDLPINKNLGFAWIVPYKGRAQFQMGWKGFVQLALRSGQYERINAKPVNAEAFAGWDDVGEPKIDWSRLDETKPEIGYAVAWRLTNGFTKICFWPRDKVEAHARRYSQAYRGEKETPWKTHFQEMALKTVVKNELARWGILSIHMQRAQAADQAVIADVGAEPTYLPEIQGAAERENESVSNDSGADAARSSDRDRLEFNVEQSPAAPTVEQSGPADSMFALLQSNGISVDTFMKWGDETGNIPGGGSHPDLASVPPAVLKRLLRASKGLVESLKRYQGQL